MDTDSVGGKTISLGAGASNNGPGTDKGLVTTGAANSYATPTGYKPTWASQGTLAFRAYFPSGCSGSKSPFITVDNAGNPLCGFQGQYFIVNGNFCLARPSANPGVFETIVATWGPAGLKAYSGGTLSGTNAFTGTPTSPTGFDLFFGAFNYNGGIVQNVAMTMDWAAILSRQLSDAEALDLSTTPSQLWAGGGGGSASPPGPAINNAAGYSGNRRAFVAGGLNLGGF